MNMYRLRLRFWLPLVAVFIAFALIASPVAADDVHWGYAGAEGPENWGSLSPDFATCADGVEQSPIDIPTGAAINAANITFNYSASDVTILNNGHTVQVNYDAGSTMSVGGATYNLLQYHFHAASENTMGGGAAPMEMHLVHANDNGDLAVVGVMLTAGAENAAYASTLGNLPAEAGDPQAVSGATVDAAALLPSSQDYYRFAGSLTTPPCSEGVSWFVMKDAVALSAAQISAFTDLYSSNARPVQSMNARTFLTGVVTVTPKTLPKTGGAGSSLFLVLSQFGAVLAGAGIAIRRRK